MSELDEVRLERTEGGSGEAPPGRRPSLGWLVVLLLVLAAGAGIAWYLLREAPEPVAPLREPVETEPEPVAAAPDEEPLELPQLAASDELVRRLVASLSSHPALASWLATDALVERFVLVVDNVSVGLVPRSEVGALAPQGSFRVAEAGDGVATVDPASWQRYDPLGAAAASLDARGTVELYRRLRPLVDEAARERVGYGADRFDQTLRRAILHLLETPVPVAPPTLERGVISYHYADPRLEDLSAAQKHLLRTGPRNQRLAQAKLRELARLLGVPEARIPSDHTLTPP
jgi:hypothetical protein